VADPDQRDAGGAHPAEVRLGGGVELELDEQLGD